MNALTHILGDGNFCCVCGEQIPMDNYQRRTWRPGHKIGLITSPAAKPVSYAVGQHDTNEPCGSATTTAE